MRYGWPVSVVLSLSTVSAFIPHHLSQRQNLVVTTAAKKRHSKQRFLEKPGDDSDSQHNPQQLVMEEETNGDLTVEQQQQQQQIEVVERNGMVVNDVVDETDEAVVEKDEQTLFDEMNMQRAIQLVIDK